MPHFAPRARDQRQALGQCRGESLAVVEAQTVLLIDAAIGDPLERGGSSRRARRAARRATLFALMTLIIVVLSLWSRRAARADAAP